MDFYICWQNCLPQQWSLVAASVDRLVVGPAASLVLHLGSLPAIPYLPIKHHIDSHIWYLSLKRLLMAQLNVLQKSSILTLPSMLNGPLHSRPFIVAKV